MNYKNQYEGYLKQKIASDTSIFFLKQPTPSQLKKACKEIVDNVTLEDDKRILINFFNLPLNSSQEEIKTQIKEYETDKFKPIINFLRNNSKSLQNDDALNLLALIYNIKPRPLRKFIDFKNRESNGVDNSNFENIKQLIVSSTNELKQRINLEKQSETNNDEKIVRLILNRHSLKAIQKKINSLYEESKSFLDLVRKDGGIFGVFEDVFLRLLFLDKLEANDILILNSAIGFTQTRWNDYYIRTLIHTLTLSLHNNFDDEKANYLLKTAAIFKKHRLFITMGLYFSLTNHFEEKANEISQLIKVCYEILGTDPQTKKDWDVFKSYFNQNISNFFEGFDLTDLQKATLINRPLVWLYPAYHKSPILLFFVKNNLNNYSFQSYYDSVLNMPVIGNMRKIDLILNAINYSEEKLNDELAYNTKMHEFITNPEEIEILELKTAFMEYCHIVKNGLLETKQYKLKNSFQYMKLLFSMEGK